MARDALEREAKSTIKGKSDIAFRVAEGTNVSWVRWTDIKAAAKQEGFTDDEIKILAENFSTYVSKSRYSELLTCNFGNLTGRIISSNRSGPCFPFLKTVKKLLKHNPKLSADPDVLLSLTKALNDPDLAKLDWDNILSKWTKIHHFGCPTCIGGTQPFINELVDNLTDFYKWRTLPNAKKVINALLQGEVRKIIGANWVMKFVKTKGLTPTGFEDFITEGTGDFTADVVANGIYYECKSWGSKVPGMGNVPNQMINYFNTQTSLTKFAFHFDPAGWVPKAEDLNVALKANKGLFFTDETNWIKYTNLFNANSIDFADPQRFEKLIDIITNETNFAKLINPN
jgi:hypothetical protein